MENKPSLDLSRSKIILCRKGLAGLSHNGSSKTNVYTFTVTTPCSDSQIK
ncbi:unnamed protein product [Tenebrio molitor]|nr:unnamed protein product [Tenebrio molitor]